MAIERKNSFHLLLSDDESSLLRLLAEREGLNASDYLRLVLRQLAGRTPPHLAPAIHLDAALGGQVDLARSFQAHVAAAASTKAKKPSTAKRKTKSR